MNNQQKRSFIKMQKKHDQDGQEREHGRIQTEEKKKEHHPYKGTIIDYSG